MNQTQTQAGRMSIVDRILNIDMNIDLPRFQGFQRRVDDSTSFDATGANGISVKTLSSSLTIATVLNVDHHDDWHDYQTGPW